MHENEDAVSDPVDSTDATMVDDKSDQTILSDDLSSKPDEDEPIDVITNSPTS